MSLLLALLLSAQVQVPWLQVREPSGCTIARAERVTIAQLHGEWEKLHARCVAVRGIWFGRALYRDGAAARVRGAEHDEASAARRVGLYGSVAIERGTRVAAAYVAVGMLYDCAALRQGQDFVGGYCHNNVGGPILAVTEMRRREWPTSLRAPW
jgi:hypothetical protein